MERPGLVVDLGSGTGLSTRAWAERASEVVGVEASPEMRARAEAATSQPTTSGTSTRTHRRRACPHERGRNRLLLAVVPLDGTRRRRSPRRRDILRPGGVFAAYDYDWPPVVHPDVEAAFEELVRHIGMRRALRGQPRHTKDLHLERIRESGHFRYAREIVLHSRERGSAERVVGMALSLGPLTVMLNEGVSEEELGLAQLREAAAAALGDREVEMFLSYRVRLGVK